MTFFESGQKNSQAFIKNKQSLWGFKDIWTSFKGESGFVLDTEQLKIIEKYNEEIQKGLIPSGKQIRKIVGDNNDALVKYLRSLNGGIAETKQFYNAILLGATGLKGMGTALKTVGKTVATTAIQFAAFTAIAWAIGKAWDWVQKIWVENVNTLGNLKKRAETATEALESTKNEIEQINQELKTSNERIAELNGKGPLTLSEQSELKRLKTQNALLEQQLKILKEIKIEQNKEASEKNLDVVSRLNKDADAKIKEYKQAKEAYDEATDALSKSDNQNKAQRQDKYQKAKKELDETQQKASETLKESTEYMANVDISVLDTEGLSKFNEELNKTYKAMYDLGQIDEQEYLEAILPTEEYDKMMSTMQALATTGKEAGADVINQFSKPVRDALDTVGISAENFAESINALRDFDSIIQSISSETDLSNLNELLSSDLDLTLDDIIEKMGQDWVDAMADAGIANDELVTKLKSLQHTIENITEDLSSVESNLKSLSDAYAEFRDNDGKVSSSTLDGLAETFSAISDTEALDNLINVLGSAKSSVADVQAAMDDVVDSYFSQAEVLANLNDEHKDLIVNQLKQMGIANAASLVEYKLARDTLESVDATEEAKAKARQLIYSLGDESLALNETAKASLDAAQKLEILNIYKNYVASGNFADVVQSHAKAIASVGVAAGNSAKTLVEYAQIMASIAKLKDYVATGKGYNNVPAEKLSSVIKGLQDKAKTLETTAETEFNNLFDFDVKYAPSYSSKKSSGGDGGNSKTKSDIYNEQKKILDNQLERNLITYNQYYNKLVKLGNKYLKKDKEARAEHYATLADVRKNAYDKYQGDLDKQLENGDISLKIYYDKSQKLTNKWLKGRKSNAEDLADAITAIGDKVTDHWNDIISKTETRIDRWNIDQTWAPGMDEAKVWEEKLKELQADYIAGLFDSTDEYYDLYYEILKKKNDALKDQLESQLDDLENRADNIQDLIDMVDEMLRKRIEEQIDLLEKQKDAYSDIVAKKKESLDLTRQELSYQRELEEKNKSLAELQAQAAVLALDDSRAGKAQYAKLLEEIKSKQTEIADFQADYTYEATTGALDDADERYQKSIQDKIDDLNAMTENQGEWLEYVYSYIKTTDPSALFKQLYDYNYQYGTGMNSTVDAIKNASLDLLNQYQSDIPKILAAIESQKVEINQAIGSIGQDESVDKSANYDSNLLSKIQVSKTKQNTHAQNLELLTQVRDLYGSGWYDSKKKIIYVGSDGDRSETAGAYELIKQMSAINQQSLSKTEKKKQLDPLLKKLQGKYSYSQSYIKWVGDTAHLYKKNPATKPIKVFHTGVQQGFVSDGKQLNVSSKQRELLALLQSGELVFNKNDQERLMVQMSTLKNLTDTLKKFDNTASGTSGSIPPTIHLSVSTPITIHGNVDDETLKKLEGLSDNIANKSLSLLQSAYEKRGYSSRVNANSMRK